MVSKVLVKVLGILVLSVGVASTAFADWAPVAHFGVSTNVISAPEIDPATALSSLTLLLGGLAVVRGRSSKK